MVTEFHGVGAARGAFSVGWGHGCYWPCRKGQAEGAGPAVGHAGSSQKDPCELLFPTGRKALAQRALGPVVGIKDDSAHVSCTHSPQGGVFHFLVINLMPSRDLILVALFDQSGAFGINSDVCLCIQ